MGYKDDLIIDVTDLESGWVEQAQLYFKYAEQHADAVDARDRAAKNLERVKATVDKAIRDRAEKVTEASINRMIILDPQVVEAENEYLTLNHRVNVLFGAVWAFTHRKSALEEINRRQLSDWYAEPRETGQGRGRGYDRVTGRAADKGADAQRQGLQEPQPQESTTIPRKKLTKVKV